ncbi:MAG: hypothetical protein ACK4GN_07265 [Runella sp.]
MNKIALVSLFLVLFLGSCKNDSPSIPSNTATAVRILTTRPWKVERITDLNGNTINPSLLPKEAKFFFEADIHFSEDKTVRAIDPVARKVVNGGSWDLLNNNTILKIDLSESFKGEYPINVLERSRMSLRNTLDFEGVKFNVNLELVPVL